MAEWLPDLNAPLLTVTSTFPRDFQRLQKSIGSSHPELGLEGQLSWEDLGAQWEHNLHELSPHVKKCAGAESATERLKTMGIPQARKVARHKQYVPSKYVASSDSDGLITLGRRDVVAAVSRFGKRRRRARFDLFGIHSHRCAALAL